MEINSSTLLSACRFLGKVTAQRRALPDSPGRGLLSIRDGALSLSADNGETSATFVIGKAENQPDAVSWVDLKLMESLIDTGQPTHIVVEDDRFVMIVAERRTELPGSPSSDPSQGPMPAPVGVLEATVGPEFVAALKGAIIAAEKTGIRPILNGVFLGVQRDHVKVIGADSFRLHHYRVPASAEAAWKIVIPINAATLVSRLPKDWMVRRIFLEPGPASSDCVWIEGENFRIKAVGLPGPYPDYDSTLAMIKSVPRAHIKSAELLKAVKAIGKARPKNQKKNHLTALCGRNDSVTLRILLEADDPLEAKDTILEWSVPCQQTAWPGASIWYMFVNDSFLSDALKAMDGHPEVVLRYADRVLVIQADSQATAIVLGMYPPDDDKKFAALVGILVL